MNYNSYLRDLRAHYIPLIERHGNSHKSVDWGSSKSQLIRFSVLSQLAQLQKSKVLDLGCGVGHMVDFLKSINFNGQYIGLDLVEEMVIEAQKRNPDYQFEVLKEDDSLTRYQADYILASGLFTFMQEEQIQETIVQIFNACKKGAAFNSLSKWADFLNPGEYYSDPSEMIRFCKKLTPHLTIRHDYMNHDFTVYLYK